MEKQEKLKRINDSIQNTMTSTIGIEITDIGDDFICGNMPVDERPTPPFGLLHGGASVALQRHWAVSVVALRFIQIMKRWWVSKLMPII